MFAPTPRFSRDARPFGVLAAMAYFFAAAVEIAGAPPNFPLEEKHWRKKTPEPDPADLPPATYSFPYPANPLGWSDYGGAVSIWVNGNWKVDLGGGETLPLRFKFSSVQNRIEDGLLGEGWWVPLLESRVSMRCDGSFRITALGGESYYFYQHREKPGTYRSRNRRWQAVGKIEGRLEVTGPGGWSYRYEGGRIVLAVSPGGREVLWSYNENDRVEALVDGAGEPLLDATLNAVGRVDSLRVAGGASFEIDYGGIPVFVPDGESVSFAGFARSARILAEVDPEGRSARLFELRVSAGPDGNYRGSYLKTSTNGARDLTRLEWSSLPGKRILSDGQSTYRFDRWIDGVGYRKGAILRTHRADECEYYHYDAVNRVDTRIRRDGSVWERSYHQRSGPTYMKLSRTREGRFAEGRVIFLKEKNFRYDEFGELIRKPAPIIPRR